MDLLNFINASLKEDIGSGDHTTLATIPASKIGRARLLVKEDGVIAGIDVAKMILAEVDLTLQIEPKFAEGDKVKVGDEVFFLEGSVRSILQAERLLLNCMQRMSGIATTTRRYVDEIKGTNAKVLDTRKTTPLMRTIEKWAVKVGGGHNHRFGLFDMILIKDNHVDSAGGIKAALEQAKKYLEVNKLDLPIEIETRNFEEIKEALNCNIANRIMFDNFKPDQVKKGVDLVNGNSETEASGGITLNNIRSYAETGVDYISVGALTHSVKSLDLSLKIY
jgi:nicotinate-nucleotide pyrophosphorylase (carboxylating)